MPHSHDSARCTRPNTDRIKAVYRIYHPRANELFKEATEGYRRQILALKDELIRNWEAWRLKIFRMQAREFLLP